MPIVKNQSASLQRPAPTDATAHPHHDAERLGFHGGFAEVESTVRHIATLTGVASRSPSDLHFWPAPTEKQPISEAEVARRIRVLTKNGTHSPMTGDQRVRWLLDWLRDYDARPTSPEAA
jgi:hypothetical protein